ncbi:MAG: L-histidine N(alpha)-methyltransferase [Rickettsiales bacterium]|jgi:uncharacterized SAM-dependent methyltransferase|nr:L-histidine N(alpha)-methyltransferase [Rickettsiales bacterium]
MAKEHNTNFNKQTNFSKQTIDQKTFNNYVDFFTTEHGADILPYAYLASGNLYDELLEKNPSYYLFSDEVSLIKSNFHKISQYLSEIEEIIEIGPGSSRAVNNKTIPILNCAPNLKNYYAIDHSIDYLTDVYKCISNKIPQLNIFTIEANLLQTKPIKVNTQTTGKKALSLLGSTLENFTINEQKQIIKKIYNIIDYDDLFILTVDTNQDEESLGLAYSREHNIKFIMGALHHLSKTIPDFTPYIDSFRIGVNWEKEHSTVDTHFIAKNSFSFHFDNYGDIMIREGQKLRGVKSRKPTTDNMIKLLNNNGFSIIDTFTNSNKIKMFLCQKDNYEIT